MINFNNYLIVSQGTQIYSVHLSTYQAQVIATLPNTIYSIDCDFANNKIYAVTNPSIDINNPSFKLYRIDENLNIVNILTKYGNVWRNIGFDYNTKKLYIPIDNRKIANNSVNNVSGKDDVLVLDTNNSNAQSLIPYTEFYNPCDIYFDYTNNLIYILNNLATGNLPDIVVLNKNANSNIPAYSFSLDSSMSNPRAIGAYKNKLVVCGNHSTDFRKNKIFIIDAINKTLIKSFDVGPSCHKIIIKNNIAYIYSKSTALVKNVYLIDLDTNEQITGFTQVGTCLDAVINNTTKDIYTIEYGSFKNTIYRNNTKISELPYSQQLNSELAISPFSIPSQTTTTTPAPICVPLANPYIGLKNSNQNVTVTESYTGSVATYAYSYTSCGDIQTPPNSRSLGQSGSFAYTLNFNLPINNIILILTGTGFINIPKDENFIITTNGGKPSIKMLNGCFSRIIDNQIFSGANSTGSLGGGGRFLITSPQPYTSLTITGDGGLGGAVFAICSNLDSESTTISTTTTTTTTTTATPDSAYFIIKNSKLYIDSRVLDFGMPNRDYKVKVNLVNPDNNDVIQSTLFSIYVDPCECVTTTTTTTTQCPPPPYLLAAMCSNGVSLGNYPIRDQNGCIIGYECPSGTTTTLPPLGSVTSLYTWGLNLYGQLGSGQPYNIQVPGQNYINSGVASLSGYYYQNPTLIASGSFTKVNCYRQNTEVLDTSGNLYQCGVGYFGEYLDGYEPWPPPPSLPQSFYQLQRKQLTQVKQNYTYQWQHSDGILALSGSGYIFGSGIPHATKEDSNWPDGTWRDVPKEILPIKCKKISGKATGHYLLVTTSGELYGYGQNSFNSLGTNDLKPEPYPIKLSQKTDWVDAAAGGTTYDYSLVVDSFGNLYACGSNAYGQLGDGTKTNKNILTKITNGLPPLKKVFAGMAASFGLSYNNELYFWGQIVNFSSTNPIKINGKLNNQNYNDNWIDVFVNPLCNYALLLNSSGELYQFGQQNYLNFIPNYLTPTKINLPSGVFWTSASVGINHAAAIGTHQL